jgi:hypothetical protein
VVSQLLKVDEVVDVGLLKEFGTCISAVLEVQNARYPSADNLKSDALYVSGGLE